MLKSTDHDVQAWIDAAEAEGISLGVPEVETAEAQVSGLKESGIWDMLDSHDGIGAAQHIPLKRKAVEH